MKLIGAAFPRTGTMSVKNALEILGVGNCYHMNEVFLNPSHVATWNDTLMNRMPNWREFFLGYSVTLDVPACLFWKELSETFPEAKVLLLRRNPSDWYESMKETVAEVVSDESDSPISMIRKVFFERYLEGRFGDRDYAISRFEKYCEEVEEAIPLKRLLIYEVSDGWEPLCEFLNKSIPPDLFPMKNTRSQFRNSNKLMNN